MESLRKFIIIAKNQADRANQAFGSNDTDA